MRVLNWSSLPDTDGVPIFLFLVLLDGDTTYLMSCPNVQPNQIAKLIFISAIIQVTIDSFNNHPTQNLQVTKYHVAGFCLTHFSLYWEPHIFILPYFLTINYTSQGFLHISTNSATRFLTWKRLIKAECISGCGIPVGILDKVGKCPDPLENLGTYRGILVTKLIQTCMEDYESPNRHLHHCCTSSMHLGSFIQVWPMDDTYGDIRIQWPNKG